MREGARYDRTFSFLELHELLNFEYVEEVEWLKKGDRKARSYSSQGVKESDRQQVF